jgi:hypothetical protein
MGPVSVIGLRDAYEQSGLTVSEIARRVDRDEAQVRRIFRPTPYYKYKGGRRHGPYYQKGVTYGTAAGLYRAMGFDPFEVGL